jgi:hypothetical protein
MPKTFRVGVKKIFHTGLHLTKAEGFQLKEDAKAHQARRQLVKTLLKKQALKQTLKRELVCSKIPASDKRIKILDYNALATDMVSRFVKSSDEQTNWTEEDIDKYGSFFAKPSLVENFYAMQNKPSAKYAPLELYFWKKRSSSDLISPKYANWDRFLVSKLRQYWNASLHKTTI